MPYTLYRQRLAELVALPSVSATHANLDMSNRPVIDLLATWFADLGFAIDIMPIPGKPNKANLIATLGKGDGGLVLSGHTDTVPYNEAKWQSDPFVLTEKQDRLYGLGSTDMKGFFPVALAAAERFKDKTLKQPLIILATADEESSMDGARALVAAGLPKARYAVIGEPTGLRPINMHKGMMMEAITVTGRAGHSSNPAYGNSALEAMQEVMTDLQTYRAELQAAYQNPGFDVQVPTLNLGCIHGGDNPNRICGECELHFDIRPLPGMELAPLKEQIAKRLEAIALRREINISLRSLMEGALPFAEPLDSDLIKTASELTGYEAESVAFATEAPFLQSLGMQTVVMGPGAIDQAHQPDEFIPLDQIQPAIRILENMIQRYCL